MFGKRNAARAEQAALLRSLGEKLDTLTGEIKCMRVENGVILGAVKASRAKCSAVLDEIQELRADIEKDRVPPEGERDPDVLTESERVNKWIMGENGDGI